MGDVAQILAGAASEAASSSSLPPPPPPPPASHQPSRTMKMTGMSREVMDLLTGNQDKMTATLPPMVPTIPPKVDAKIKVGNKFISASKPARKWVWAPFTSSARTDGALFRHWVRGGVDYPDYPYARFDIHLDPVTYTDEEYRRYLQDAAWTKSETDRLMELARCFELRWAVIHDRWRDGTSSQQSVDREVEDLQYRYYHVAAKLTQLRIAKEAAAEASSLAANAPTTDPLRQEDANAVANNHLMETAAARALATTDPKQQPLVAAIGTGTTNKKVFDLAKERERRKRLEFIWNRTKEEELEEAQLRKELRLLDTQIRKLKKNGGHILAASAAGPAPTAGLASGISSAASSANPSRSVSPVPAGAPNLSSDSALLDEYFASTAPTPMPGTPYLQSGRLVSPATGGPMGLNKTILKRMENVLQELNIPGRPLPTKRVCDLYDAVRKDALALLTLQKMALQREGQLQAKRLRLAKLGGGGRVVDEDTLLGIAPPAPAPPPPAPGSTGRSKVTAGGGKGSKGRSGSGKKAAAAAKPKTSVADSEKADGSAHAIGGKQAPGGKTAQGGKSGRKTTTKRKRKSESSKTAASTGESDVVGPGAAGDGGDGKPTKKRARKS